MGFIRMMERGGDDYYEYKKALKEAKEAIKKANKSIEEICEITEDMEDSISNRGGYSQRGYMRNERDWEEMSEKHRR